MTNLNVVRINSEIQPNMQFGVYLKSWDGSINGSPPTGGGGGKGILKNVTLDSVVVDGVNHPVYIYQSNGGESGDIASYFQFTDVTYRNWSGSANENNLVSLGCSSNAPCTNLTFIDFDVSPPSGENAAYTCKNAIDVTGLNVSCG